MDDDGERGSAGHFPNTSVSMFWWYRKSLLKVDQEYLGHVFRENGRDEKENTADWGRNRVIRVCVISEELCPKYGVKCEV